MGGLFLFGSLVLFTIQTGFYLRYGVWPPLPAIYLFIEPHFPKDEEELQESLRAQGFTEEQIQRASAPVIEATQRVRILGRLMSFIPGWLRGGQEWFEKPRSWFGLHEVTTRVLSFLSIPGLLAILGIGIGYCAEASGRTEEG